MEGDKIENTQPPVVSNPPPYAYYSPEDEINLADLWWVLVRRKKVLFGVTALVTLGSVLYALLATPVYRAEAIYLPPTIGDIQALNIPDVQSIDIETTYKDFERNLGSVKPREVIFEEMNLLDQLAPDRDQDDNLDEIFNDYNETFTIATPKAKKDGTPIPTITFAMEWEDPVLTAQIVNRVAETAERAATIELISDIKARITAKVKDLGREIELLRVKAVKQRRDEIERLETADRLERNNINDKIASLRQMARGVRLDRIAKLKEATDIAHKLEIQEPFGYRIKKISAAPHTESQILTEISETISVLYTRGYEPLDAEIESLSKRTADDPFISELRGLQEKLNLLETNRKVEQLKNRENDDPFIKSLRDKENELARLTSIVVDPATVKTARLDQAAYAPEKRIKPKRKLIVVLGLMLGLMLGVFAAFFVNFIENQKQEQAEA